ncbi:aliphatic sulfonate ABC transporter substrate-binding protein [Sporomusa malonica]|uniref:Putative aliphatic sulfonates-binding protein n=1 Tax=Sporomusa malonica TaxID=112901 RepID=A0A1W1YMQ9_9FIRM|nr:aliphatic sulfonate ABC transporter substrate-binding protein [Sporomusa malonica]SMC37530.1 sulfonate transport system substrate-binding protein [Sporomusa malonica]
MRKWTLITAVCGLLLATLLSIGCSSQPATQSKNNVPASKEIRIGIVPLPHYAHMWVAKKKGFIDEELQKVGFNLKWQPFGLGPMVSEAFAAGHLDMGVMGDFPAFIGRSAGTNYRIVSIASAAPKALALVVKKDSNVAKVTDLKGKKVATTKGAYGQKLLTLLLEQNGLQMNDIQFIHMTMDDLATALLRGDVDAGVMWEPLITRMEEAGEIRNIADGTGVYEAYAVLMASGDVIDQNPEAVDALLKAYQRGNEYLKQNPEECVKLLQEDMKLPEPQLAKIISKFNYDGTITERFVSDMKDTEQFMQKNGLLKSKVEVDAFIRKR